MILDILWVCSAVSKHTDQCFRVYREGTIYFITQALPWQASMTNMAVLSFLVNRQETELQTSDLPNSWSWLVEDPELEPRTSPKAPATPHRPLLMAGSLGKSFLVKFRGPSPPSSFPQSNMVPSICLNARESKESDIFYFFIPTNTVPWSIQDSVKLSKGLTELRSSQGMGEPQVLIATISSVIATTPNLDLYLFSKRLCLLYARRCSKHF